MKVRIEDEELQEIELPMECDYGAILNEEDVIIALTLPVNEHPVYLENIDKIILNVTTYKSLQKVQDKQRQEVKEDKRYENYIV